MIDVTENYRELQGLIPTHEQRYMELPHPKRCNMTPDALGVAVGLGLMHRGRAPGASVLVLDGDPQRQCERRNLYALCPLGSEVDAATQMVSHIATKYGPGDWWTVGPDPIDYSADDGRVPCGDIDGVTHVLLRCYFYHDPRRDIYPDGNGKQVIGLDSFIPECTP